MGLSLFPKSFSTELKVSQSHTGHGRRESQRSWMTVIVTEFLGCISQLRSSSKYSLLSLLSTSSSWILWVSRDMSSDLQLPGL